MSELTDAPKLPALIEFNPETLGGADSLFELLNLLAAGLDRASLIESIRARWFDEAASSLASEPSNRIAMQKKLAGNVISGMRQAGLVTTSTSAPTRSALGDEVARIDEEEGRESALKAFAAHLLRERYGIELLEAARFVRRRDGVVSKRTVVEQLRSFGFDIANNNVNYSRLRDWLAAAGVVDSSWNIDETRFEELAGVSAEGIAGWSALSQLQRQVLTTLRVRAESDQTPIAARDLVALFRLRGLTFDEGQLRRDVYDPLANAGWIVLEGTGGGRARLVARIVPTEKTLALDVEKIENLQFGPLPADLREQLATPLANIFRDLPSSDTHTKGIALELLALRLVAECGLFPVELRARGIATGGAEVDLVAEGAHLHFSRWLFQCKNTGSPVRLEVLAKEVGMATLLRAQVVVIVSTGGFARSVLDYARQAAANTAIQIVLLDQSTLTAYQNGGSSALRQELHGQALQALTLKQPQRAVPTE
ncbi:restriction endonuclease [Microbacterium gilvum]|uniref:Restriction endonuclease type IV Mrr domain-containing protein n=1 Tax=Microbacterium gilvum TaxID=1336204 RepID=A0ABP9ASA5_9MICO